MKIYKLYICVFMLWGILACNTENDVILPSSFHYISFEKSEVRVKEGETNTVLVKFLRSSELPNEELIFNYDISFPEGKTAAQENVDYSLPDGSGTIKLPAGKGEVEVELLTVNDNTNSAGDRYIQFDLKPTDNMTLGSPADAAAKSVTVIIGEDDLATIAYTSFEEVPAFVGDIYYNKSGTEVLQNTQVSNPSSTDPYVDFTATGDELGFDSSFLSSDVGDSGIERIGVFKNENLETAPDDFEARFVKGTQGFVTSDLDGTIEIVFDEVTSLNSSMTGVILEANIYIGDTSYETGEGIEIFYKTADGLGDPIISYVESTIEKGTWLSASGNIPADKLVPGNIVVRMKNSSNSEMIFLDYIAIKGIP
ncbi:hypothetical protein [Tenacibaculum xiamenense]|uniref:hypothetical protein n=1 Tax=Tenacibaculum xiamenense TaxID=1261553 RepID=UPI003893EE7A